MRNSTILIPTGVCPECKNGKTVPICKTTGLCLAFHHPKYRQSLKAPREHKPRVAIPKESKKRAAQKREYRKKGKEIYGQEWQPCARCGRTATACHHIQGRENDKLNDFENTVALCPECHDWAHDKTNEAKAIGLSKNRIV
jgi:hypothetical protein